MNRFLLFSQCVVLFAVYGNIMGVDGAGCGGPSSKEAKIAIQAKIDELKGQNSGATIEEEFKVDSLKGADGTTHEHVSFISITQGGKLAKLELVEVTSDKQSKTISTLEASTIKTSGKDAANKKLTLQGGNNEQYEVIFDRPGDICALEKLSSA